MFLNLLFKAIKADPSQERIKAFIKRLLQVNSIIEKNDLHFSKVKSRRVLS